MTTPIADAAMLAAGAGLRATISPKDLELGPAWLDLRGVRHGVALGRASSVVVALGTCLSLQSDSQLFVTAEPEEVMPIAQCASLPFVGLGLPNTLIAVIRGEDVSSRLEELMAAGVDIRDNQPPHKSLLVESRTLVSAIVSAPPSVLRDAIEAGARVVISRSAERGTIEDAVAGMPDAEAPLKLTLRFHNRHEVTAAFDDSRPIEELKSLIDERLPKGVFCEMRDAQGVKLLDLSASKSKAFALACKRCDLLLDGLPTRLESISRRVYDEWTVDVPAEHFEFGFDLRPASEWLEG